MSIMALAGSAVNRCLSPLGVAVIRARGHDWGETRDFLPFAETIAAAERRGLSLCDYIDEFLNKTPGATQATLDAMKRLGVFAGPLRTIVEIGPGSGRYLEKTLAACSPQRYEVYETAGPWASYIQAKYGVILQPTDGRTLSATPSNSADLVQAHKVFCGIPSLPTFKYWTEMARVCRSGGWAVFDALTEACLDGDTFRNWVDVWLPYGPYPAALPRIMPVQYFTSQNFGLVGTFLIPLGPGKTELFVFRKH
jgi:hypothetical protein